MELVTEPDIYTPSIDNMGNYIDKIPSFTNLKHGIRCPCGSRKDKVYSNHSVFSNHIKTKTHKSWLSDLNLNKSNFYVENETLRTTIHNQKMIIAKYEKEIQNKNMTIDYLTKQLVQTNNNDTVNNLIIFD